MPSSDPPDYAFLKSGRGMPDAEPAFTAAEVDAFTRRATSMAAVMTRRAAEVAATVADHRRGHYSERETTKADVTAALKYQAMHVLHSEGLEEDVIEAERELFGDGSVTMSDDDMGSDDSAFDEDEGESDSSDNEKAAEVEEVEEVEEAEHCACETCAAVRVAVAAWAAWDPSDPAEAYLKKAVTEAETRCSRADSDSD